MRHASSGTSGAGAALGLRRSRVSGSIVTAPHTSRPLPSGRQLNCATPSASCVSGRASPPLRGIACTCGVPDLAEMNASRVPSGDHAGALSPPVPAVNGLGSPPSPGKIQMVET
ncbi:MAG TPA: hypothetical protein VM122_03130 [Usitatibacter sp.]|nr:hypothetical protein [Usitatibacter sp.]